MNRDTIVYCSCTFILGLVIGSFLIGPKLAKPSGAPPTPAAEATPAPTAAEVGGAPQNPMGAVMQQIAALKKQIAENPDNAEALAQLGNMYMDATKYPEAIGYYERSLAIRDNANVRVDLGICYKQSGQSEKSLAAFHRASTAAPDQWQPLYNEAIVLAEMKRFDEAKAVTAKLKKMRPDDPDVQHLEEALRKR